MFVFCATKSDSPEADQKRHMRIINFIKIITFYVRKVEKTVHDAVTSSVVRVTMTSAAVIVLTRRIEMAKEDAPSMTLYSVRSNPIVIPRESQHQ